MKVETWISILAALAAIAALYFNRQSTKAAVRAADAVEKQTEVQEQLRIDAAQPYVWVDVRGDEFEEGPHLNLVVGNSGPTVAQNVRVKVDPALPASDTYRSRAQAAQVTLANGIESLPPGRELTWPLGWAPGWEKNTHKFTITADGPFGPVPTLTYIVDMSNWEGTFDEPKGNLHKLTLAVKELGYRIT